MNKSQFINSKLGLIHFEMSMRATAILKNKQKH